ncbi:carbohydrate ABC transporter permease [Goodfellowiella coeruleoviolacea]|uniref:Xylobiose transport system permease protein n=1 Tax=Goodfellowiella coeruleoviolacea TaxID=334858 RepID=A0AAE3KES5_9PSEU|nr:sugar ABC transporter permease [Goodfellowiella coeruleoviolacea]MCP2164150.1 xylobiose transport system permease protein [Goodfellowiella coeruleoviolacea]
MTTATHRRVDRPGGVWALPALVLFGLFALLPMLLVGYLSLTAWNGLGNPSFIGMANWTRLFTDPAMLDSLRLSVLLTVLSWVIQTPISLLLGVWAAGRQRNRAVLSAIFFLPLLLSSAAIAVLWRALLDPNFGLAATLGPLVGFADGNIAGTPTGALLCVAFVASWQFIPLHTLFYQSGARQIPESLYEAALIDGASRVQQFRHITLPQLRNTIVSSSVLMVVGALTFFDTVLILTNGGPGTATYIVPFRMYTTAFRSYDYGYASAIAFALVLVATAISLLLVRVSGFARMRSTREGM